MENSSAHILVVDDEILNLEIMTEYLGDLYTVTTAENGQIAWDILAQSPEDFDVILLDRMMPDMSGMEVLEKIKQHPVLQHCPVIFQTAKATPADISEGLNAGAYYYLTKPFEEEILLSVTRTAVSDRIRFKDIQKSLEQTQLTMGMLRSARFEFKTLEEAHSIASLISHACPEPTCVVMGLTELMINAIEHGNLGISYQEKTTLNEQGHWSEEVNRRLQLPENQDKTVSICFQYLVDKIEITIIDQGHGFDWENYLDFAPDRIMDNHGRGIAVANKLSFSAVEYRGTGNEVCATLML